MAKSNGPVEKFRLGYVTATVWKNGDFYSVNVARSYKDEQGEWKETDSLNHHDLLNGAKVLQRAEEWISKQ